MILEPQEADLTRISPPQAEDHPSIQMEPTEGSGTRGTTTSDISQSVIDDGSPTFSEVLESVELPLSSKGIYMKL